ncbi:MAG: DUF3575 domain-containing protein [Bacteroidaceae bacterium]|nr:DUF3575 domain-containing protein [Bacteroidaceae bacterium]
MRIKKYCITLILLLFGAGIAHSQESSMEIDTDFHAGKEFLNADTSGNKIRINKQHTQIEVHFKFDKYNLDLDYMGNDTSLRNFAHKIDSIGISNIDSIVVVSQSSPEGVYEHNLMLSRNRANTMRKYILDKHPELLNCLHVYPDGESWFQLREYIKKDTLMKKSSIEKVISIIDADINVGTKKWRMEQLPVYRYLLKTYYPRIRNSSFYILYYTEVKPIEPIVEVTKPKPPVEIIEIIPDSTAIIETVIPEVEGWSRKLHLKTNAIGLGMAIANVAAEIDLAKHWSFTLPVYYSAWDYFKSTIKFRTFAVQPELRYWLSEENDGFFGGAHFSLAYYNFAFDGDYRYQDHNRETPSIGGGVSIGYRMPISKNNRWRVEFSLGAGVYSRHYDKFYNTPRTKDGLMIESIKKTYWGIDQAAVSFSYSFDLKKKGGKR